MSERPAAPAWLDEISAAPGPPFLAMGVRTLPGDWLLDGPDLPDQLAAKRRILAEHHDEAFAALPSTEPAAAELLAELTSNSPTGPRGADPSGETATDSGPADPTPANRGSAELHPLDVAGRLVAEDLCLLIEDGDGWVLGAGSVCFPSHWRLTEKLGRPVAEVHGPVPHYQAELATRVDRFLSRLGVGRAAWRRNWSVHTDDRLFAPTPPPPPDPPIPVAEAGERLWFRSEYQTLRRLPRTGAVVFSIRTQQVPLARLAHRPDVCSRLAESATTWPPDLIAYRGGPQLHNLLLTWLHRKSLAAPK